MTNLPNDLKYARSHEWLRLEDDNTVHVGITDFAQQELGDLVYIELPQIGRQVKAQEQCAVVESVKTASELYSPVSGKIIAINQAAIDDPELVNNDPYKTWLFALQPENIDELANLLSAEDYRAAIDA